jgi:hypothetical protein
MGFLPFDPKNGRFIRARTAWSNARFRRSDPWLTLEGLAGLSAMPPRFYTWRRDNIVSHDLKAKVGARERSTLH